MNVYDEKIKPKYCWVSLLASCGTSSCVSGLMFLSALIKLQHPGRLGEQGLHQRPRVDGPPYGLYPQGVKQWK